jgi:hypothetical protein
MRGSVATFFCVLHFTLLNSPDLPSQYHFIRETHSLRYDPISEISVDVARVHNQ